MAFGSRLDADPVGQTTAVYPDTPQQGLFNSEIENALIIGHLQLVINIDHIMNAIDIIHTVDASYMSNGSRSVPTRIDVQPTFFPARLAQTTPGDDRVKVCGPAA